MIDDKIINQNQCELISDSSPLGVSPLAVIFELA